MSAPGQAQQLVQAVSVFRLAPGEALAAAYVGAAVERRGPDRAKNITRPRFGSAKPVAPKPGAEAAPAKTGTDGEWVAF